MKENYFSFQNRTCRGAFVSFKYGLKKKYASFKGNVKICCFSDRRYNSELPSKWKNVSQSHIIPFY